MYVNLYGVFFSRFSNGQAMVLQLDHLCTLHVLKHVIKEKKCFCLYCFMPDKFFLEKILLLLHLPYLPKIFGQTCLSKQGRHSSDPAECGASHLANFSHMNQGYFWFKMRDSSSYSIISFDR